MIVDAYNERKTAEVMEDTWGHLAPKKKKSYHGYMIYTHSAYGDIVLIDDSFACLGSSPRLFADMQDFIGDNCGERGTIYKWEGEYRTNKKGYCGFFKGTIKKIKV